MSEPVGKVGASGESPGTLPRRNVVGRVDIVLVVGFALCAGVLFYARWRGLTPFPFLTDDAGNIASFAAAGAQPELFEGDALLGDPDNIRFYSTVHAPIIRGLASVVGDYGTAFVSLLGPHIFLQALGFYVLGRVLAGHRFWAVLFTVATLVTFKWKLDFWGLYVDPTPRVSYQCLLPFLLAAAYYWRSRTAASPAVLACAGLLMYVHPVSAPSWAFALWCGVIPYLPSTWSAARKISWMLLVGVLFLAVVSPFLLNYVGAHDHGVTADYEQVFAAMEYRFAKGFLDIPRALGDFLHATRGLWPPALVGAVLLHALRRKDIKSVLVLDLWVAGLMVVAILLPLVEHAVARAQRMIPLEIDLIRNIRYLIPCMLIFILLPLADIHKRTRGRVASLVPMGIAVTMLLLWIVANTGEYAQRAATGQMKRQYKSGNQQEDWPKILAAIRSSTPSQSRILPVGELDPLPVRYIALRPVVHCRKDGGCLAYSNHAALLQWFALERSLASITLIEDNVQRLQAYAKLARDLHADYLLLPTWSEDCGRDPSSAHGMSLAFETPSYLLLRIAHR